MTDTRELGRETWSEYFDALSREALYAPVSIETITFPGPPIVQTSHLALLGLTYDRRNDVFEIAAACGGPHLPSVLRHLVEHPEGLSVDSQTMLAPVTIMVEGPEDVRAVITIGREPEITG